MTLLDLLVHAEFDVASFLSFCSEWGCVVVCLSVQPPPTGPGVVGPSLPGGAPVPRFTPLLLQWREQAERVLMKFASAIIVHFPVLFCLVGGWCFCLLNHLRHSLLFFCSLTVSLCGRCFLSSPASSPSHSQFWHLASGCLVQKTRAFPSLKATSTCSPSGKSGRQLAGLSSRWLIPTRC